MIRRLIMFGACGILLGASNSCNRARSSLHDGQIVTISDQVQNQVIYRDGDKVFAVACEVGITERVLTRNDCPVDAKRDSSLSYKKEYLPELKRYLDYVESSELQSEIDAIDTILAELGAAAITESVKAERTGDPGFVQDSFAKQKDLLRKQREKLLESQSNYEVKSEIFSAITTLLESPDTSKRLYHPGKAAVAMVFPFLSEEEKLQHLAVSKAGLGEKSFVGAPIDFHPDYLKELRNPSISARQYAKAISVGAKMVIWGGNTDRKNKSDGAIFDVSKGEWSLLPSSSLTPRSSHSAAAVGGKMYIWGGYSSNVYDPDNGREKNGAIFDPETGKWSDLPKSPLTGRFGHSAATVGTKMYIWGGYSDHYSFDGSLFDASTGNWTGLPIGPLSGRSFHSATTVGTKMIIWGGTKDGRHNNDGAIFETSTGKWSLLPKSPLTPRRGHNAVAIGEKLIVWGGTDGEPKNDGAVFDISIGKWSLLPESPVAARHGAAAAAIGQKMIIWGGTFRDHLKGGAVFDVETFAWEVTK